MCVLECYELCKYLDKVEAYLPIPRERTNVQISLFDVLVMVFELLRYFVETHDKY